MSAASGRRAAVLGLGLAIALAVLAGCTRDGGEGVPLAAPFDEVRVFGTVTAAWQATDEERAFAGGVRLAAPEVRVRYRLDVETELEDKAFIRLSGFTLVDEDGHALGDPAPETVACTLGSGRLERVLAGDVWIPESAVARINGFRVERLAVPLSERGRGLYHAWRLEGRPDAAPAVDAEIAGYAAAPPCTPR